MPLIEATIHLPCSTFKISPCLVHGFNQSTSELDTPEGWEQPLSLLFQRDYVYDECRVRDKETIRMKYNIQPELILNAD